MRSPEKPSKAWALDEDSAVAASCCCDASCDARFGESRLVWKWALPSEILITYWKTLLVVGHPILRHTLLILVDPCWLYRPVWWSHGRPVGCSHGTSLLQETPVVLWFYLQWSRWALCGVLVGTRCVNVWKPETADFCHRLNFWRILGYWGCVDLVAWIIYYYIHISIIFTYLPSLFLVFETYSSSSSYDVNTLGLVKRSQVAADDFADQLRKRIDARIYEPGAVITAPRPTFSGKMMMSCR